MRKKLLILVLILTVLGGGAAVFIGYYLNQQNVGPEDTNAYGRCPVGYYELEVGNVLYCYRSGKYGTDTTVINNCSFSVQSDTVCLRVTTRYLDDPKDYFFKHWCNQGVNENTYGSGCNCPASGSLCSTSHSRTPGTSCSGTNCNPEVAYNNTYELCLSLNTSDCNFQQIDYQRGSSYCFLSGGIYDTSVCSAPPVTTPPVTTPPVTTPPVTTPPVTTPPITTPPVTTPPVTTPVITTPPITTPPVIITISVLPTMAIISDKADMVIGGSLLVVIGISIYALGFNEYIGKLFWKTNQEKVKKIRNSFENKIKK